MNAKVFVVPLFALCVQFSVFAAAPQLRDFTIMGWCGPVILHSSTSDDEQSLQVYRAAHFNLLSGTGNGYGYSTSAPFGYNTNL